MPAKNTNEARLLDTRKCDSYGNYEVYLQGGGAIPAKLRGIFTSKTLADNALANYLETQGIEDEKRKAKEEIKAITPLDHEYDDVEV